MLAKFLICDLGLCWIKSSLPSIIQHFQILKDSWWHKQALPIAPGILGQRTQTIWHWLAQSKELLLKKSSLAAEIFMQQLIIASSQKPVNLPKMSVISIWNIPTETLYLSSQLSTRLPMKRNLSILQDHPSISKTHLMKDKIRKQACLAIQRLCNRHQYYHCQVK